MGSKMNVGIIGVGNISAQYLAQIPKMANLSVVAISDIDHQRAKTVAEAHGVKAMTEQEILAEPQIDIILNLTIPAAHSEVTLRSLHAGKHVYGEKPLALSTAEGKKILNLATEKNLRVGSAPDTILGTGIQTVRECIDSGKIGSPIGAAVAWSSPGHELWHPSPHFYYQPGGGPLFDMGPYYLSSLVLLLGSVVRVSSAVSRSERQRKVASGPAAGTVIPVDTDTHISAILEHENGSISTVTLSFEVWESRLPLFEIFGTKGTIAVPDPNMFSGKASIATSADRNWQDLPVSAGYLDAGRGVGLADLAHAIEIQKPHRCSAELAFHVLEIMESVVKSGNNHSGSVELFSRVERPSPVDLGTLPETS